MLAAAAGTAEVELAEPELAEVELAKVELAEGRGRARAYALGLDGHDPGEVAARVARAVHEKGYALFELRSEQRDIEAVFAQIAAEIGRAPCGERVCQSV